MGGGGGEHTPWLSAGIDSPHTPITSLLHRFNTSPPITADKAINQKNKNTIFLGFFATSMQHSRPWFIPRFAES